MLLQIGHFPVDGRPFLPDAGIILYPPSPVHGSGSRSASGEPRQFNPPMNPIADGLVPATAQSSRIS